MLLFAGLSLSANPSGGEVAAGVVGSETSSIASGLSLSLEFSFLRVCTDCLRYVLDGSRKFEDDSLLGRRGPGLVEAIDSSSKALEASSTVSSLISLRVF